MLLYRIEIWHKDDWHGLYSIRTWALSWAGSNEWSILREIQDYLDPLHETTDGFWNNQYRHYFTPTMWKRIREFVEPKVAQAPGKIRIVTREADGSEFHFDDGDQVVLEVETCKP